LAHRFQLPLFEDLGSGWLGGSGFDQAVLRDEPPVVGSLAAGVDLVAFSGDKLLGGPQSGLIVGRADLVERVRRHPLMRALRVDKLTYAALEATLALWAREPSRSEIPVYRMLTDSVEAIGARAQALATELARLPGVRAATIDGVSTIGGGSAPGSALPTRLIALGAGDLSASALEARLRAGDPPVIARIQDDRVVLDLRTVMEDEEQEILEAVRTI
jgi:L-seryl-tRNA(Ser) seleniumtransferase